MMAAYRILEGRPHHVSIGHIVFGGWFPNFIYYHPRIHRCHPVEITYVHIADRRQGRSRGPRNKATIRVPAEVSFDVHDRGIDQLA